MAKIFLIEDDRSLREQLMFYLQGYGYQCVASNDFSDIINLVLLEKPDLVLLDIMLPKMDGLAVCKRIRQSLDIPILHKCGEKSTFFCRTPRNVPLDESRQLWYNA